MHTRFLIIRLNGLGVLSQPVCVEVLGYKATEARSHENQQSDYCV